VSTTVEVAGALTLVYSAIRVYLDVVGIDGGREPFTLSQIGKGLGVWLYLLVRCTTNAVTVYFAWKLLAKQIDDELIRAVAASFVGVFAFEIVIKGTDIKLLNQSLVDFDGWFAKLVSVAKSQANIVSGKEDNDARRRTERDLSKLPEATLMTILLTTVSDPTVRATIEAEAAAPNIDSRLFKAYKIVAYDFQRAKELLSGLA
jgi:hypothetical protein